MNKSNNQAWNTKYGPRRVRHEEPTLDEAITAAKGLSDELNQQAEIAASLIGLPARSGWHRVTQGSPAGQERHQVVRVCGFGLCAAHRRG